MQLSSSSNRGLALVVYVNLWYEFVRKRKFLFKCFCLNFQLEQLVWFQFIIFKTSFIKTLSQKIDLEVERFSLAHRAVR